MRATTVLVGLIVGSTAFACWAEAPPAQCPQPRFTGKAPEPVYSMKNQLFWIIRFGSPDTAMPAHKDPSDEQIWELVLHIRHLAR